ncbi:MAG: hypothetical protein ACRD2U_11770 [Terriglobales bacterium]
MSRPTLTAGILNPVSKASKGSLARVAFTLLAGVVLLNCLSAPAVAQQDFFLVVSRVQYDGNTFGSTETYPYIFSDPNVSGVQGSIHLDLYLPFPNSPRLFSLPLKGIAPASVRNRKALLRAPWIDAI